MIPFQGTAPPRKVHNAPVRYTLRAGRTEESDQKHAIPGVKRSAEEMKLRINGGRNGIDSNWQRPR